MKDNGLLKEIYEKGRVRKLQEPEKKLPPFMKGRQNPADAKKREIGSDAAKRRLQAMKTAKKPEAK
jgi:hypothetical protein